MIQGTQYHSDKCHVEFYAHFITLDDTYKIAADVIKTAGWDKAYHANKRNNVTFGDDGLVYKINWYGKVTERKVIPWTCSAILQGVKERLEKLTQHRYNTCIVQLYPHGKVYISKHRDKEMKSGTTICGVSLGVNRTLRICGNAHNIDLDLNAGSLYILHPPTNDFCMHEILLNDTLLPRISLTFRNYSA